MIQSSSNYFINLVDLRNDGQYFIDYFDFLIFFETMRDGFYHFIIFKTVLFRKLFKKVGSLYKCLSLYINQSILIEIKKVESGGKSFSLEFIGNLEIGTDKKIY